ncbi:GNAT family N-acetyltransferase [Evansella tamaricis]|uniref:GNAT family N-acetyltransferase n=1 Tax=Evansella tamaricis TaxID=2069301 RepID=A0ABS6JDB5_9BACI|nr:GNAT family N-acetyltransferase [Evansella tamaricis]MBU9711566.1 GNAT family N-acetyltransferase [Evansella tamaricis]
MLHQATEMEKEFILTKAADSLNEGMNKKPGISKEKAEELLTSVLNSGAYYLVHCNEEEEIQGWALIGENMDYISEKKVGFIFDLHVLTEHRGKGLSKVLIKESVNELKNKGYSEVRLNVYASNFAKDVYKRLGFSELQSIMYLKV